MRFYAGIGSRHTPKHILQLMTYAAQRLDRVGWTLRSGGAAGADSAFAVGAKTKEVYLPWPGYNELRSQYSTPTTNAIDMASDYHPNWLACSQGARKLHGRNCHIVLGQNLDTPVDMIICWTPQGKRGGGTGQALRMTKDYPSIKVYDLALSDNLQNLNHWLDSL